MGEVKLNSKIGLTITVSIELTLPEAKALKEMIKYGHKSFLEGYYKQLGRSYMQPHEKGLISLFDTIRSTLPDACADADQIIEKARSLQRV